jgi:hypothetical protein
MNSEERRNLWHTTLESVALPDEKLPGETNCWMTVLLDWSLLHQVYNHKKATIARYRMLSTMKSIFVNLNYTSIDLQNPLGPTLGFVSLDDSISAAVTVSSRIANTNQQYSIPLPANVIYLYKDVCTEEIRSILTRSVRSIGLDIPVVGHLDYVQEKRVQKELHRSLDFAPRNKLCTTVCTTSYSLARQRIVKLICSGLALWLYMITLRTLKLQPGSRKIVYELT